MRVPAADPYARIRALEPEVRAALDAAVAGNRYILGPQVEAFEEEFARYLGAGYCVGVASGTDAITLALLALGIEPGAEVICPALTAHGTAIGIQRAGARPVFADVEERTRCLDPRSVEERIGPRTAAIVAVHLHGLAAPVDALRALADRRGLALVEDAAQAHGGRLGERRLGTFGHAAAFSFYPTKNLGCLGDGGMVATGDRVAAERIRRLRCYGWDDQRVSSGPGFNSRLDEIQAAVLRVLLPALDRDNERRRRLAARYGEALARAPLGLPPSDPGGVYHQYAVLAEERDALRRDLAAQGIGTDIHYPVGLHRMPAFPDAQLPVTDSLARRLVSLPIQPEIAEPHAALIAERVLAFSVGKNEGKMRGK
jgi:dTDP-3-amino-3,4,6-trideoxy-alpha-D-glucose transaminase